MKDIIHYVSSNLLMVTLLITSFGLTAAWCTSKLSPAVQGSFQAVSAAEPRRRLWLCAVQLMLVVWQGVFLCFDIASIQKDNSETFFEPVAMIAYRYVLMGALIYGALAEFKSLPDLSWRTWLNAFAGLILASVSTVLLMEP